MKPVKHIIIGDLHGRNVWEEIKIRNYDKIIFLGDYVDSPKLSDFAILENLKKIIRLKKRHPQKVILLLGNHDINYLHYSKYPCSSFRRTMQPELTSIFNNHAHLFQVAYQYKEHIFTHAGITNVWYAEFLRLPGLDEIREPDDNIADLLNKVKDTPLRYLLYAVSFYRGGHGNGGIVWADARETADDMLTGYHQVVGHTRVKKPHNVEMENSSTTFIDVLDNFTYFHELDL